MYTARLVVPSVSVYEVFRRDLQRRGEGDALLSVALRIQGQIVPLDAELVLAAAKLSVKCSVPLVFQEA